MSKRQLAMSVLVAVTWSTTSCSSERGGDGGVASKPLDTPGPAAAPVAASTVSDQATGAAPSGTPPVVVGEEPKAAPVDVEAAARKAEAIPECAELERRSLCSVEKLTDEVARKEVKRALEEAMATWGEFATDEGTRSQAASACTQAMQEGESLWTSQGC